MTATKTSDKLNPEIKKVWFERNGWVNAASLVELRPLLKAIGFSSIDEFEAECNFNVDDLIGEWFAVVYSEVITTTDPSNTFIF